MNREKIIIAFISIFCMLVIASPILENWKDEPKDDFPLSYYPLFIQNRGEETIVAYLYGGDKDKNYYTIPNNYVIPGSAFNSARMQIARIIINNQSLELCEFTAKVLRIIEEEPFNKITHLGVVSSRVNITEFMNSGGNNFRPKEFLVHAKCRVR